MTENKFKGTPGKWTCKPISDYVLNHNRGFMIYGFETPRSARDVLPQEITHNANLIAAAPELLEALQELVTHFKKVDPLYPSDKDKIANAEAAINKALGK
jgi:hypothetical protein